MQPANSCNWQMPVPIYARCQITENLLYFVKQPSHPKMLCIKADLNEFHVLHHNTKFIIICSVVSEMKHAS
jgi:hypothetical protein